LLRTFFILLLLALFGGCRPSTPDAPPKPVPKRIAITFDDVPIHDGPLFTGEERARHLIAALKGAKVPQAAMFVTTGNIRGPADEDRLRAYAAAGHVLANHSHGHRRLNRVSPEAYLADIDMANRRLRGLPNLRPWFRFPYLNEGGDQVARDAVRAGLTARGLANGYVTIDTWDWALVDLVRKAKAAGREIDMAALRDLYLEMMLSAVATYDAIAMEHLGRSPAHVLLAHENDLAALFIDDLVAALRHRGWAVISPDQAYTDPIAAVTPDTMHLRNGRVAALAAVKGVPPERLSDGFHDEKLLKALFDQRVMRQ
jgi:peptidoglycan/xylan/chitin deacetylase (PgdA/CDA1 family)